MYFTNISYKELLEFHNQVKVNFKIKLTDVVNSGLFKVESIGELLKIYPIFYTDRIESTNSNDKIMDNQCIICEDNEDTILYFIADEKLPVLSLEYSYYSDFVNYIVFYLYDGLTGSNIYNATAEFTFKENDEITKELTLNSDRNGIIYLDTTKISYDELTINFKTNGATKTFEWSSE